MRALIGGGLVLVMVTLWAARSSDAQERITKRDDQGPVSVTVALNAPPGIEAPLRATVVLDTHSVTLDGIRFEEVVALRMPDGSDLAPTAVEQATGSGHHRQAVLVFPPIAGPGDVRIVVKNVGGVAERSFSWELRPTR